MLTPVPQSTEERGKRWLEAQVQQMLTASAPPVTTRAHGAPVCYWGIGPETETTLYLRLTDDLEPKALRFRRITIRDCGAGLYVTQHNVMMLIRWTLKNMGLLPA